ncbi:methylated-DNA--[protein]-cysteine S-methyltransferase [Acidocella sp.]|uniref:methylated-DNA--[protein]-cysteine S-methyltransferase n=1 Tax=Acidocella sp. TaxID=50710 RepID=UPI003CFD6AC0
MAKTRQGPIETSCRLIDSAQTAPGLEELARKAGMGTFRFHRLFKQVTGLTPKAYAVAGQGERLREAVKGAPSITDAIYEAGFSSSGRFYEAVPAMLGMTPGRCRARGQGERLSVAIGETTLGALLVAASAKGVCAIALGPDPELLLRGFLKDFSKAEIVAGDAGFETLVAQVAGLVEMPERGADLPLDLRGTVFQRRVWTALREIPPGRTLSYGQLAARIGAPSAVRAVAAACGANRLAVAVPCHRVVARDGALTGYRWGVERKAALLAREAGHDAGSVS